MAMIAEVESAFDPKFTNVLRQQENLRLVIESISSELEFRPLLTLIVRQACELIGADNGTLGLVDEARKVIRTEAVYNISLTELGAEVPIGVGLAGQVFRDQQPLRLDRYGDIESPFHPHLAEYTAIGVPIFWREMLVGVFGIGAAPPRRFTDQEVETLALFARHAAIALENARLFTATQQTLHETELLYQTSQRISMALEVEEVIDAYLGHIAVQDRYACSVVLYEFDEQGQRITIIVYGRWTPETGLVHVEERYPYLPDTLDSWLDIGQTVTIADVYSDPRVPPQLREIQRQSNRPALALIPLMVRGQRIGLVILSETQVHHWAEADLEPYQVTAAQLAVAIDSRRQRQLLTERGRQVAILEERQRLARDLHDSVTQLIFSITLIAQSLKPAWERDPVEGSRRVNRLITLSQSALAEMRALLAELRPAEPRQEQKTSQSTPIILSSVAQIQEYGLVVTLHKYLTAIAGESLQVNFVSSDYKKQPSHYEETLYRIAQEALNNIVKHAQAQSATVTLYSDAESIYLSVADKGVGLSPLPDQSKRTKSQPQVKLEGGFGLTTMQERAESLGGTLQFKSTLGQGTTIFVSIPRSWVKPFTTDGPPLPNREVR